MGKEVDGAGSTLARDGGRWPVRLARDSPLPLWVALLETVFFCLTRRRAPLIGLRFGSQLLESV